MASTAYSKRPRRKPGPWADVSTRPKVTPAFQVAMPRAPPGMVDPPAVQTCSSLLPRTALPSALPSLRRERYLLIADRPLSRISEGTAGPAGGAPDARVAGD